MDKPFSFLEQSNAILCLDIGSGTQDVLLAIPKLEVENWPRFVLPSPARNIAKRIENITYMGKNICLHGHNMGGGFFKAIRKHLDANLKVYCTPAAAYAIHDDQNKVTSMGIEIVEHSPNNAIAIHLSDYSPDFWQNMLLQCGLPQAHKIISAVQDHGVHAQGNRIGRMQAWRNLLQKSNNPEQWLYTDKVPQELTRLATLQSQTQGAVADTGTAAILGALCVPEILDRSYRQGITIINVGNSHIIAFLVYMGKVMGIFEHHTGQRNLDEYLQDLKEFKNKWLPDEQVRSTGGHGTAFADIPEEAGDFMPTFILGPKRDFLKGYGQFIAPHGDMMLTGCFGLLKAVEATYKI